MLQLPFPTYRPINPRFAARRDAEPWLRALDFVLSATALAILMPLMTIVAFAIWASDGSAPFFVQDRLGLGGRSFRCLKFRTMAPDADRRLAMLLAANPLASAAWRRDRKLVCDPRITPLGRLLRHSSIDELPQLLNVLFGQMSLVGPRPIVAAEVASYGRHFANYCDRRPGLTGMWQVRGRSRAGYRRRLACDRLFSRHRSVRLYLRILLATVPAVVLARGAC